MRTKAPQSTISREGWGYKRVYSQYTSREVFTDPAGVEWVRVSREAFNPERGDVEIAMRTRGLGAMTLRRRDSQVKNLGLARRTPASVD